MWLIATDEAGYGPKLGPLVIVATTWKIDDQNSQPTESLADAFSAFHTRIECQGHCIRVDDSKAIFKPRSAIPKKLKACSDEVLRGVPAELASLHLLASSAASLCCDGSTGFDAWLDMINPPDHEDRLAVPWLSATGNFGFADESDLSPVLDGWRLARAKLHSIDCRVLTAMRLNAFCSDGKNKSDLLSESTLGLVRTALRRIDDNAHVSVHCDRHGGRRYYAGVIQHVMSRDDASSFDDLRVVDESRSESHYQARSGDLDVDLRFTVKGDSFTPVSMSSLIAKYIRERMMLSLNAYFASKHRGKDALRPTAGYPVDADRFLEDIAEIIQREKIERHDLVRQR